MDTGIPASGGRGDHFPGRLRCGIFRQCQCRTSHIDDYRKEFLYGTKTVNFEIKAKDIGNKDREEVGMAVTVTAAAAGGADKEPVITATYNGMTLEKGTDYTVGTDIINAGNGTYRRVITGIGNYRGTYTVEYRAAGADLSDLIQRVTAATVTYNGNAQTPEPDITWKSGNNDLGLVEGTDYPLLMQATRMQEQQPLRCRVWEHTAAL